VKSSSGCRGNQGSKDSRSTKFKGYLKFGGVFYIGVEELGLILRNSCKHIVINICYLVDDLGEGVLHQKE
jgi:hypothetical protein